MKGRDERKRRETLALEGSGGVANGRIVFSPQGFSIVHTFGPVVQDVIMYVYLV